jgi:hypothetical protein
MLSIVPLAPRRRLVPLLFAFVVGGAAGAAMSFEAPAARVVEAPPPAAREVRPCLEGRGDSVGAAHAPQGSSYLGGPWIWTEVAQDCRAQIVTLAATDRVRVSILDGAEARTVELPQLAVPRAIDHYKWDAGIDLVIGLDAIVVVGQAAEDLGRVRAMVSTDGGLSWTARDLGATEGSIGSARMRLDGTIEWSASMQRW